ncbi:MAG: hypothetical protein Terrestrivirus4_179 [Terrestrivirus sp.]|uniref:Uncharacterized protein n=1 Tax=Terrestrivirus sp. TaxID=2487775 RepID=A0A3G4ZQ72_9VIRU|nr:MAG: hypothetical protein Terrestrivirus4_179 [Terrestrivirus sp.]
MNSEATKKLGEFSNLMNQYKQAQKQIETKQMIVAKHLMTLGVELQKKLNAVDKSMVYIQKVTSMKTSVSNIILSDSTDSNKLKAIQKELLQDTVDTNNEEINTSVKNGVTETLDDVFNTIVSNILKDLNDPEVTKDQMDSVLDEQKTKIFNDVMSAFIKSEEKYKQFKQDIVDVLKDNCYIDSEKISKVTNCVI